MPGGDRTGPAGLGPMTGRGAGYCAGYPVPGYMNTSGVRGMGMALGRGFGRGRGFRRGYGYAWNAPAYMPPPTPMGWYGNPGAQAADQSQELEALRQQAEWLAKSLDEVNKRIDDLQSDKSAE